MLPSTRELDDRVQRAERAVIDADQRLRSVAAGVRERWMARAPTVVATSIFALVVGWLVRPRRRVAGLARTAPLFGWQKLLTPLVNIGISRGVTLLSAVVAGLAARKKAEPPVTVPHVDLERYAGLWYEIARLPLMHERACASDVTALYELSSDGLRVINRCRRADGRLKTAAGRARIVDTRTNAKLKVSFAPAFLDLLPFVWGDYWVLELADDYSAAMVGTPDRKYLWLLARMPSLPGADLQAFLGRAQQQGYDVSRLEYARHSVRHAEITSPVTATAAATEGETVTNAATVD